ncbi:MAG: hypothetical protein JST35_04765 [Armatimonadetes bacterium]|nr:hypothetical protein [Armatimonadota bacterium]
MAGSRLFGGVACSFCAGCVIAALIPSLAAPFVPANIGHHSFPLLIGLKDAPVIGFLTMVALSGPLASGNVRSVRMMSAIYALILIGTTYGFAPKSGLSRNLGLDTADFARLIVVAMIALLTPIIAFLSMRLLVKLELVDDTRPQTPVEQP